MADQADVETALVSLIATVLYPDGTDETSIPGPDCRIYRGWPSSAALDADLAAGRINVTVFPLPNDTKVTSRYTDQWQALPVTPTLLVQTTANSIIFDGEAHPGQVAGILADGRSYVYRLQAGDTVEAVAANLAALARADWIVQLHGGSLTFNGAAHVAARVVADTHLLKEVRRQEQGFRVSCWCPTPGTRDITAAAIDQAFAGLTFIDLPDASRGRISYRETSVFDQSQDALLYRRDLVYSVEYPTIIDDLQPAMLFGDLGLNATRLTV